MKKFFLAFSALFLIAAALHLSQSSQQLDTIQSDLLSSKASKSAKATKAPKAPKAPKFKTAKSIDLEELENS